MNPLLLAFLVVAVPTVLYVFVRWAALKVHRLRVDWQARRDTSRRLGELP